jgi:hypothetical protein
MIVDLMRNDIGRVAVPGSVRVPELFVVEPFPAVHHLVSTVTAKLPAALHASDLLRAAFPGGSITGAPKFARWRLSMNWNRSGAMPGAAALVHQFLRRHGYQHHHSYPDGLGGAIFCSAGAASWRTATKRRNIRKPLIKLTVSCSNWRAKPWRSQT